MMLNEYLSEDLKKYIHDLERKIAQLEKDLKKESAGKETFRQSNKKLKKENEKLKKIRPLRQVAFLLQRFSTNETDRKERKSPLAVSQVIPVTQRKNQLQTHPRYLSY
jgi:exonuclease VII small subunit